MQSYNFLDLNKFLLAILLVCAHTISEQVKVHPLLDLCFSLYIVVVPFFFTTSAFLFFKKINKIEEQNKKIDSWKHWSKRILSMYGIWSAIYFVFVLITWYQQGITIKEFLTWLLHAIFFTTYATIWFLPALWVAVSISFYLVYIRKYSIGIVLSFAALTYIVGNLMYTYGENCTGIIKTINDSYKSIFSTWRNGFFNGFVFTTLGCAISKWGVSLFQPRKYFWGSLLWGIAFVAEAFLTKHIQPKADANFLFSLIPFTFFFVNLVLCTPLEESPIWIIMRKMSLLIFVSQRIFLSALPSVLHGRSVWSFFSNPYMQLLSVVVATLLLSYSILLLSRKIPCLKRLM